MFTGLSMCRRFYHIISSRLGPELVGFMLPPSCFIYRFLLVCASIEVRDLLGTRSTKRVDKRALRNLAPAFSEPADPTKNLLVLRVYRFV